MLSFVLLFTIPLILSAMAINGFYNITRGEYITKPDGSRVWVGKIFSFWSKYLQRHTEVPIQYTSYELKKLAFSIKDFFFNGELLDIGDNYIVVNLSEVRYQLLKGLLSKDNVMVTVENIQAPANFVLAFYKSDKKFKIPFWITAPLGECITCLSSFWGIICAAFWYSIINNIQSSFPGNPMEAFFNLSWLVKFFTLVFWCISLAWLNEFLFFINNKLKQQ